MTLPTNFQFSQGSLQDYVDCPRRFQLKYIQQLAWPAVETEPALENEIFLQQGAAFHQLVQQYFLGVSQEKLGLIAEQDANLVVWWENFLKSTQNPEGLSNITDSKLYPELSLSTPLVKNRLFGKFDLLAVSDDKLSILDWKTSRQKPKREWISSKLQSRVYPYLLVKAGSYLNNSRPINPPQIEMVYWFANFPIATLKFAYNNQQFKDDQKYINSLIDEINSLDKSQALMTENEKLCHFCIYRSHCNRGIEAGPFDDLEDDRDQNLSDIELDFDQIAEIEF